MCVCVCVCVCVCMYTYIYTFCEGQFDDFIQLYSHGHGLFISATYCAFHAQRT